MSRKAFSSEDLAPAAGPFSAAVQADELIFLSGQVAQDATGTLIRGDVAAQTEQIFRNLRAVLSAAGRTLADVVRVGVYLTDMRDFASMNTVYERQFERPHPARTTIAVSALPLGATVEIDLVAR
ncbi:MAG TPA: Rid family detoxifying hydrolase [Steroidobacteraceae bacterium]